MNANMSSNKGMEVYSAMQTEKPYKTYKKVILGKVFLNVLNPFSDEPEGILLEGNPKKNEESCFFHVYNEKQDVFLKRMNREHFKSGTIIEVETKSFEENVEKVKMYSDYSDEDIEEIVQSKHFKLESVLNEADSEAFVYRLLEAARDLERPEKTIKNIEARLSELQRVEVPDANTE